MKTKLLLLLFFANLSIYAQYTNIPDVNFENKLINLGIDSGTPDGKVLTDNIDKLTYLDVRYSSINDLAGIQDFTSLITLYTGSNQLKTLDVSKNNVLAYLDCSSSQLTSLDLSKNTVLEYLDCDYNQLTSLDVSKNTRLASLICSANSIKSLDISNNIYLRTLFCAYNSITTLDISKNYFLKEFACNSNYLKSLDASKNTLLETFYCDKNQLTSLDLSKNTALKYLDCTFNQLTTLDLSSISLETLSCYSNQLTSLNVSKSTALKKLYCNSNQITSLDFSNNTSLETLLCGDNQLTDLNLKNGKNTFLSILSCSPNPNLTCIQVDDAPYSDANWYYAKDVTAIFSTECTSLVIEESVFSKVSMYPNPTKGEVTISNVALDKASVYNSVGQLVRTFTLDSSNTDNTINLSGLVKGVYYIYLINQDVASAKKVIVE